MPPRGIKKQALGGVLFSLGVMTALLAKTIGFELDIFYVVISIIGACLFLYGALQKNQHKLTSIFQHNDVLSTELDAAAKDQAHTMDVTAYANLANPKESR